VTQKVQFNTDCEGPITKNDNAQELVSHFIPKGDYFYSLLSAYDDYLAYYEKRPGYNAGNTLRLVVPFLKAYGLTNERSEDFSRQTMDIFDGAIDTLEYLSGLIPCFIISTSYEQYIRAFCKIAHFAFENTYCTEVDFDFFDIPDEEVGQLKDMGEFICTLPKIELPGVPEKNYQAPQSILKTVEALDGIFFKQIPSMEAGKQVKDIVPVGGREKKERIIESLKRTGNSPAQVCYVGDSITDVEAFEFVRQGGGLTISFNGNRYAIESAEIACLAHNTIPISILVDIFRQAGKRVVLGIVKKWSWEVLQNAPVSKELSRNLHKSCGDNLPEVNLIADRNMQELIETSEKFRGEVRGKKRADIG
jgi:energy-converting hydrogenase A subunit R